MDKNKKDAKNNKYDDREDEKERCREQRMILVASASQATEKSRVVASA